MPSTVCQKWLTSLTSCCDKISCQRLPTTKPPITQAIGPEAWAYKATKYEPVAKNAVDKISDSISCLPLSKRNTSQPNAIPMTTATTISYAKLNNAPPTVNSLPLMTPKIAMNKAIHTASLNSDSPSNFTIKWCGAFTELNTPLMPIGSVAPKAAPSNSNTKMPTL